MRGWTRVSEGARMCDGTRGYARVCVCVCGGRARRLGGDDERVEGVRVLGMGVVVSERVGVGVGRLCWAGGYGRADVGEQMWVSGYGQAEWVSGVSDVGERVWVSGCGRE